jgi:hypothetical protein
VLVGKRIIHIGDFWDSIQDGVAHFVHSVLHTGAVLLGKRLHRDRPRITPRPIEFRDRSSDRAHAREGLPRPPTIDISAQDSIPDLRQGGVFIPYEAMELTARALQDQQSDNARADVDALAPRDLSLDVACLGAVAVEGVGVWLAVDAHACPAVGDHLDVRGADVGVGLDEVGAEDGGEEFGGCDGVFFGFDIDGVLHRVGGYYGAVVCFRVSRPC